MEEIKLNIPEGCKAVTVKVDGCKVTTEFEPAHRYRIRYDCYLCRHN